MKFLVNKVQVGHYICGVMLLIIEPSELVFAFNHERYSNFTFSNFLFWTLSLKIVTMLKYQTTHLSKGLSWQRSNYQSRKFESKSFRLIIRLCYCISSRSIQGQKFGLREWGNIIIFKCLIMLLYNSLSFLSSWWQSDKL